MAVMPLHPLASKLHLTRLLAWLVLLAGLIWLHRNVHFESSITAVLSGEEGRAYYSSRLQRTLTSETGYQHGSTRGNTAETTVSAGPAPAAAVKSPNGRQDATPLATGFDAVEGTDLSTAVPQQENFSSRGAQTGADQAVTAQHEELLMITAAAAADPPSGQHEQESMQLMDESQADTANATRQQLSTDPTVSISTPHEDHGNEQLQDVQEIPHASTEVLELQEIVHTGTESLFSTAHATQTAAAEGDAKGPAQHQQQQGTPSGTSLAGGFSMWRPFANLTTVLESISAHWMGNAADQDCPAPDVQHTTECPQQDSVWQAPQQAAAPGSCAAQDAEAGPVQLLHAPMRQQVQLSQEDITLSTAGSGVEFPPGAFLTPQLMLDAYLRIGALHSALYVLAAVLSAVLLRAACNAAVYRLFRRRRHLSGLPLSIQRDPKAQEAFFALRQLCFQKRAWWRLVGVSAVAVSKAKDAHAQASSVASKARRGASFARGLLRQQEQRLQADKAAALQQLEQELRAESAEQQQQAAAAHALVVEGLQGEIQQHLQKQQQQSEIIRDISEERATLAAEQRQNKEAMVGLNATISSLQQQLQDSKQGHAQVRQQYEQFCKEIAKGQGWKEALELKMHEAAEREQALASKCEGLHEQLSQANSTISHLRFEGQHKDATIAARDAACSQLETSTQHLQAERQQLLYQHAARDKELQAQLAAEGNQHAQTRIKLQHELVQRQTAEESLRLERQEKQDLAAKADGLQSQLTSTTEKLSQLKADHAAAKQTLTRLQADLAELEQQHEAAVASSQQEALALQQQLSQRGEQISQQARELSDLADMKQQIDQELQELQEQLQEMQGAALLQDDNIEQLIKETEQERVKLADLQRRLQEAVTERDMARERCLALEERVEQQQQDADLLEQQFAIQQQQVADLRAKLEANRLNLQEAQRDLSIKMEQYEEEDRKNRELGAENGKLQREVAKLTEHERQLEQALEELDMLNEQLVTDHKQLQESFATFLKGAEQGAATQDAALAHITERSQELATKLAVAEAEVCKLTSERDELSKRLYWAEIARDQTKAAKEIATEDAIKARQTLKEERARNQITPPARAGAVSGGRGVVGTSIAAAAGEVSSSGAYPRGNNSVPAKRWGTVEPAYLHQHYKDKNGAIRRAGSPTPSNTHSNDGSTPGTPRSTATSGGGGGDSSTPLACGRPRLRPTSSNASAAAAAAAAAGQQEEDVPDGGDGGDGSLTAAAAAGVESPRLRGLAPGQAAAGSPPGSSRLRRQSTNDGSSSRLQECSSSQQQQPLSQQEQQPLEQQEQQQQEQRLQRSNSSGSCSSAGSTGGRGSSSPGRNAGAAEGARSSSKDCTSPEDTPAAAAEGLRRNFSDSGEAAAAAAAAGAAEEPAASSQGAGDVACTAPVLPFAEQPADHSSSDPAAQPYQQQDDADAQQPSQQQQQQHDELCASPEVHTTPAQDSAAEPPLGQGGASPSLCSSGTQSRIRGNDFPDMRPLALSPVQQSADMFPMQQTLDMSVMRQSAGGRPVQRRAGMPPMQQSLDVLPSHHSSSSQQKAHSMTMSPLQHSSDLVLTGADVDSPGVSSSSSRQAATADAEDIAEGPAAELPADPEAEAAVGAAGVGAAAGSTDEQQQVLAALQCTAASAGLASGGPSAVSAPGTPAATATAGATAPVPSLEGPVEDLTFFTPLQANRRRSSNGSGQNGGRSSQDSAAAASGGDADDDASTVHGTPDPCTPASVTLTPWGEQGSPATVHGTPSTPYFTPGLATAGVGGASAAGADAGGVTAAAEGTAAAASAAEASGSPSSVADSTNSPAADMPGTAAEKTADAAGSSSSSSSSPDRNGSSSWLRRMPDSSAPQHSSSSPSFQGAAMVHNGLSHAEDGDVVLIGSLSEADFAGLGLGVASTSGELQGLQASALPAQPEGQLLQLGTAADAGHEQRQEGEEEGAGGSAVTNSMDSISIAGTSSSTSSAACFSHSSGRHSDDCAPAAARAAAVPRLPLFQLHTAAAAADGVTAAGSSQSAEPQLQGSSSHSTAGANAAAAGPSGPRSWQLQDSMEAEQESSSLVRSSGNSSARVNPSAAAAAAAYNSDAESEGVCEDGGRSSDEEDTSLLVSDVDTTPPRMFIGNVPPAAAAAVAAVAGAGATLSPRMVQHSPRYHDQRTMHSPRYADHQQQQQQGVQGSKHGATTTAAAAQKACGSSDSDDDADHVNDDLDALDAAPRAAAAAAGDAGGLRHSSSSKANTAAKSPAASSPTRSASATALDNNSPPAAAAAGGLGSSLKFGRGSSRLADTTSSSCSSIKSLVAHGRQQQQLRRTGSNGSMGSAGSLSAGGGGTVARSSSVLESVGSPKGATSGRASVSGAGVTGVTDQLVASKARRVAAAGGSPSRSIAAMAASKAAAAAAAAAAGGEQQSSMQGLLSSTGSIGGCSSLGSDKGSPATAAAGVVSAHVKARGSSGLLGDSLQSWDPLLGRSVSSSSSQEQHVLSPPRSSASPQPNAAPRPTAGLMNNSSSSSTPPGASLTTSSLPKGLTAPVGQLGRRGSLGRGGSQQPKQQQQSSPGVLWRSLDDFVHAARTSGSAHSSPGVGPAAAAAPGVGRRSSLPPFLSPPAASTHINLWASPLGAYAAAGPGVRGSAGSSGGSTNSVLKSPASTPLLPAGTAAGAAAAKPGSSPHPFTPAAAMQNGVEDHRTAGAPVLPVAEGVCEGPGDADSPNSMLSGGSGADDDAADRSEQPDAWVVQENPVYFELH